MIALKVGFFQGRYVLLAAAIKSGAITLSLLDFKGQVLTTLKNDMHSLRGVMITDNKIFCCSVNQMFIFDPEESAIDCE